MELNANPGNTAATAIADVWRRTLSQIPTVYGRLVYLASLRSADSGRYEHHGLSLLFGAAEANQALCECHEQTFAQWLDFTLEEQKADLSLYIADLGTEKRALIENWLLLAPYRNLMPALAGSPERDLFLNDLAILLDLLKNQYGAELPDPDA